MPKVAMISVHTCPMATLGGKSTGGMNVYVRELSRELGRRGFKVDIFTRAQNPAVPQIGSLGSRSDNVRVIHIPAGPQAPYPKERIWDHLPQFARGVLAFAEGASYHLIDAHYWLSGWVARELRRAWRAPWLQRFHTLGHLKNSVAWSQEEREPDHRLQIEASLMADADLLVAGNPHERDAMIGLYGAPEERIRIVPCGVDPELFHPISREEALQKVSIPCGHRMILYVGRIEPLKGIDTLLRAMALLSLRMPGAEDDLCLTIIGGDPDGEADPWDSEMSRLQELKKALGLANLVTFLGNRSQEDLPYYYAAAEVCVVPSRYESFGMVALEAMACGTPVIASRVGGLAHTVQDGVTGYLVPEGDAQVMADRLQFLLTSEETRRAMGSQGALVAQGYTWSKVADQVQNLYEELLGKAKPASMGPSQMAVS